MCKIVVRKNFSLADRTNLPQRHVVVREEKNAIGISIWFYFPLSLRAVRD